MASPSTAGSHFTGPIQAGNTSTNWGTLAASQTVTLNQNSTTAVSATMVIPANSQITNVHVDVLTAFNSATSAVVSVGTAAAGTQYVGSVDAKTGGRATLTLSAAQVTAMNNVGTNTNVVATVTPTGATSAGSVAVTIIYVQR